jgi:hypothetical protein
MLDYSHHLLLLEIQDMINVLLIWMCACVVSSGHFEYCVTGHLQVEVMRVLRVIVMMKRDIP